MFKKLSLLLGAIVSGLLLYIKTMQLKTERKERRRDKASFDARRKADETLIEGMINENKPVTRGHFDDPKLRK